MSLSQSLLLLLVVLGIGLSFKAAQKTRGSLGFYCANGQISAWQNGLALAGDYLSAAAFLGAAGLYYTAGYDSLIYAVGTLMGWPLLLLLLADKLREKQHFTVADMLASRFGQRSVRWMSATSNLLIVLFYLIVQLVGAGKLIELLFHLPYLLAVILVAAIAVLYVALGGMLATTWIQLTKASLLIACALALAIGIWAKSGYSLSTLMQSTVAHSPSGAAVLLPSPAMHNPWEVLSLGLGLVLGLLGLPHVLMRFFTVADARAARQSACYATGLIALFFTLNAIIGAGGIVFISHHPSYLDSQGHVLGGSNMVVLHLAHALGGNILQSIVAAVVFTTLLAVIAGLTLAGASSLSHDLYTRLWRRQAPSEQHALKVSRIATLVLVCLALLLSILFRQQNIAILMGLAFAIAASGPFPVLLLALFWRKLSAQGALVGGYTGLASSILLILLGPTVWVNIFGFAKPLFPLNSPAICSVPLAFFAAWLVSTLWPNSETHGANQSLPD